MTLPARVFSTFLLGPHVQPSLADGEGGGGGGVTVDLTRVLTPGVLAVIGVLVLILILVASLAAFAVYRKARGSGALTRAFTAVQAQTLPPGPGQDLARLRQQLQQTVSSTRLSLISAQGGSPVSGDATGLSQRILEIAADLDRDLGLMLAEPDPAVQRQFVPDARERVTSLVGAAGRLRAAVVSSGGELHATQARALAGEVDDEANRLQQWRQAYRELGGGSVRGQ